MKITNEIVSKLAKEIGFDLVGFSKAEILEKEITELENWLNNNFHAGMSYMARNVEKRKDVSKILLNAESVISVALNYFNEGEFSGKSDYGKVSRYAWGKDYHFIMWDMLEKLTSKLKEIDNKFESVYYVDTGPVMDKVWAERSGIGWMGKHSNIITRQFGSWIFLGEIITNYKFSYNEPIPDFCGTCTACIDACPTDAIVEDYVVDANKCISYLTIENKNEIPDEFIGKFNNWIFGCDICQDVCPWNKKFSQQTVHQELKKIKNKELEINKVLSINNKEFKIRFKESPIFRAKLKGLKRNAEFLRKNS